MTKVSIIVPVYNVSEYIERCILSIIKQTFNNIECILINDCTEDDSIEKSLKLINNYTGNIKFKIFNHKRNRGLSAARNTGTENANGEYIYYLDSDDEITPDCIELLVAETQKYNDIEMVMGNTLSIPYNSYYDIPFNKEYKHITDNNWIRRCTFGPFPRFQVNAWNKLLNKNFLLNNNISFKEGLIHEDELWFFYVSKKLSNFSVLPKQTYIHYRTNNSIMNTLSPEISTNNWYLIIKEILPKISKPYYKMQLFCYLIYYLSRYNNKSSKKYKSLLIQFSLKLFRCGEIKFFLKVLHLYFSNKVSLPILIKDTDKYWKQL